MLLHEFNDKHKNEDIFIIGNSPELNDISEENKEILKKKITIGVNGSHMFMDTTYWICGHPGQVAVAEKYSNNNIIKFFQKADPHNIKWKEESNIIPIKSCFFNGVSLVKTFDKDTILTGSRQIGFSSTHLAYMMGAKRIIYIGFDQRNKLHFYNYKKDMLEKLERFFSDIKCNHSDSWARSDADHFLKNNIVFSLDVLSKQKFYPTPWTHVYKQYFKILNENNVETISTMLDSVLVDAGAKFISLGCLL